MLGVPSGCLLLGCPLPGRLLSGRSAPDEAATPCKTAMLDLATEREHLAKADRDIAEGEARISHQVELIERLREQGHDLSNAKGLLSTLEQTLQAWRDHRDEIIRTIARLESGGMEPG